MSNFRGVYLQRSPKREIHITNSLQDLIIIPYMYIVLYGYLTDITFRSSNMISC